MQKKSLQFHISTGTVIACAGIMIVSTLFPSFTLAAEKKDKDSENQMSALPSILDDAAASSQNSQQSSDTAHSTTTSPTQITESTTTPAATPSENPTPSSEPHDAQATTTDEISPSTKNTPSNTPTYTKTLQNILNQKTNTILRTRTSTSSVSTSTNATTTITQTSAQITSGDSNQLFPTNYYAPLDKLSPQATYGLSALAMMCGIIGAVCVLREPKEKTVWTASPLSSPLLEQSLLES